MKRAFILAAGLGTRLKPWTDRHPKALVKVGGEPMLKKIIERLATAGFDSAVINLHHFPEQIEEFVSSGSMPLEIRFSDERECLLETGGGLLKASPLLFSDGCEDILVHNVDILSNADLKLLYDTHLSEKNDVTLLVSNRESSRKLLFDRLGNLSGWKNLKTGELKPSGFIPSDEMVSRAFSGIYMVNRNVIELMHEKGQAGAFPIMDFLLSNINELKIKSLCCDNLKLIDIGKPESLVQANL